MDLPKIGAPATRALAAQGITNLEDLSKFTKKEFAALHGMGPNALGKLDAALKEARLDFKPE